jgi:hypothetical protein
MAFNWREHLAIHPAAELFPLMSEVELKGLAEDIEKNGPRQNIVLCGDPRSGLDNCQLVDGRNRLDALAMLGFLGVNDGGGLVVTKQHTKDGKWIDGKGHQPFCYYLKGEDPYALALSYNVHRRHLTAEQKRELIAKLVKAKPEASDREIAKQVKADHKTVGAVRAQAAANGEIPHKAERTEAGGRKARGRKPAEKKRGAAGEQNAKGHDHDAVERPEVVEKNLLDTVGGHMAVAGAYKKIFKLSSFDRETKIRINEAITKLINKWQSARHLVAEANAGVVDPAKIASNDGLEISGFLRRTAQATQ